MMKMGHREFPINPRWPGWPSEDRLIPAERAFKELDRDRVIGWGEGTVILGALWSLWHLPFFVGPLSATGPDATFVSVSIAFIEFTIGLIVTSEAI
jgi:hypothetical protein